MFILLFNISMVFSWKCLFLSYKYDVGFSIFFFFFLFNLRQTPYWMYQRKKCNLKLIEILDFRLYYTQYNICICFILNLTITIVILWHHDSWYIINIHNCKFIIESIKIWQTENMQRGYIDLVYVFIYRIDSHDHDLTNRSFNRLIYI